MDHRNHALKSAAAGFTLVELMLVLVIAALLLSVSGDIFRRGMDSQRLAAAARQVAADLDHVVLLAQKENRPVEARFYQFVDADAAVPIPFRAYQFAILTGFNAENQPVYRMLSEVNRLPEGTVFMPLAECTTLHSLTHRDAGTADPDLGTPYRITSFLIRPDGTTTLPDGGSTVLTIVEELHLGATLPPNYRSITIDPANGHTRVY